MKFAWIIGIIFLIQPEQVPKPAPITSEPLTIIHEQKPIMTINRSDLFVPIPGFPFIDTINLQRVSDQVDKQIRRDAENARIDNHGNIVPEQAGIELNRNIFNKKLYTYFYQKEGPSAIEVPLRTVYPRVDSELLTDIRDKVIGHYVTYFNSSNKQRSHNLSLAAKAIDNQVVFPGEVFSFNQVVGERTKAKGYLPAKIIVKGEYSEGIGGGICQISSTLFNAVDRAGLHILQRYSHSRSVPYVPSGRDATVSWNGPDFTFKNEYNQPILIRAKVRSGIMVILVYSSDMINFTPKQIPSMAPSPNEKHLEEYLSYTNQLLSRFNTF